MRHLTCRKIWNYIQDNANGAEKLKTETHLATCAPCCEMKRDLEQLWLMLSTDHIYEPPPEFVQAVRDAFRMVKDQPEKLRKMLASGGYDRWDGSFLADGTSRLGIRPRQLIFRADDVDVDLTIESTEANNRVNVEGQVLASPSHFFENAPVKLQSHGIVRYQTRTNEIGEFSFDEGLRDTYYLSVELPETEIMMFFILRANAGIVRFAVA